MLRRNLILMFILVVFVGCGNKESAQNAPTQKSADYVQQGMDYLAQADVTNAIQSFDSAIRNDPTNVENYLTLGQVYLRLKSYDRAADTFNAATKVSPNSGDAYYFLALSQKFQGPEKQSAALKSAQHSAELFVQSQQKDRFAMAIALVKAITEDKEVATPELPK